MYEIGRIFRNEGVDCKHNPEFTMLESYEAYADYNDVMAMIEEMVAYAAVDATGRTKVTEHANGDEVIDFTPPWRRLTMREALIEYAGLDLEEYREIESLQTPHDGAGPRSRRQAPAGASSSTRSSAPSSSRSSCSRRS